MVMFARAIYDFDGTEADDLSFKENDVIEVVDKDESGWWTGKMGGKTGDFPFNYVEVMSDDETKKYLSSTEGNGNGDEEDDHGMTVAGDQVDTMKIMGMEPTKTGVVYLIESSTTSGTSETAKKSIPSFRTLDSQLRTLLPDFEGTLPPKWADKATLSDGAEKLRKEIMDDYVSKLVETDGADFLLVPWLFPGRGIQMSADSLARAQEATEKAKQAALSKPPDAPPMLARVAYTWEPEDRVELNIVEGDVVAVFSRNTGSQGWWEGQLSSGIRGLFPSNHVELMDPADAIAWMNGDASKAQSAAKAKMLQAAQEASQKSSKTKTHLKDKGPRKVNVVPNFFLGSTSAFDDLLDRGYAVEGPNGTPMPKPSGPTPSSGEHVKLSFTQYIWDSQKQVLLETLASSDADEGPMEFVIDGQGDDADPSIIKGLHSVVKLMSAGMSVRAIISPPLAYGAVGIPPIIPPHAHIVFDLKLESIGVEKPRRMSLLFKPFSGAKPEVQSRNRPTSLKMLQPLNDRPDSRMNPYNKPPPPKSPNNSSFQASSSGPNGASFSGRVPEPRLSNFQQQQSSFQQQSPMVRRNNPGHVMLSSTPPPPQLLSSRTPGAGGGGGGAYSRGGPKKTFEYQVLRKMVQDTSVSLESQGIDRTALEDYLTDSGFVDAFQMDRTQFLLKPKWRQVAAKRQAGLF